jgi:hypothetical protein
MATYSLCSSLSVWVRGLVGHVHERFQAPSTVAVGSHYDSGTDSRGCRPFCRSLKYRDRAVLFLFHSFSVVGTLFVVAIVLLAAIESDGELIGRLVNPDNFVTVLRDVRIGVFENVHIFGPSPQQNVLSGTKCKIRIIGCNVNRRSPDYVSFRAKEKRAIYMVRSWIPPVNEVKSWGDSNHSLLTEVNFHISSRSRARIFPLDEDSFADFLSVFTKLSDCLRGGKNKCSLYANKLSLVKRTALTDWKD